MYIVHVWHTQTGIHIMNRNNSYYILYPKCKHSITVSYHIALTSCEGFVVPWVKNIGRTPLIVVMATALLDPPPSHNLTVTLRRDLDADSADLRTVSLKSKNNSKTQIPASTCIILGQSTYITRRENHLFILISLSFKHTWPLLVFWYLFTNIYFINKTNKI